MPGPVPRAQHHVPRLHGRAEAHPAVGVAAQPRGLREVVRAVRRPGAMSPAVREYRYLIQIIITVQPLAVHC